MQKHVGEKLIKAEVVNHQHRGQRQQGDIVLKRAAEKRGENEDRGITDQQPLDASGEIAEKRRAAVGINRGTHAILWNQDIRPPPPRHSCRTGSAPRRKAPAPRLRPPKSPSMKTGRREWRSYPPISTRRQCPKDPAPTR